MQDSNFVNPLTNPIFFPIINRFLLVFALGFILILILNKGKIKKLWENNLGKRYLSWLIIGGIYVIAVFFGGYPALLFLLIVMILALWEIKEISKLPRIYSYALYLLALVSILATTFYPEKFYTLPLLYFVFLSVITIRENNRKGFFN